MSKQLVIVDVGVTDADSTYPEQIKVISPSISLLLQSDALRRYCLHCMLKCWDVKASRGLISSPIYRI